jgi:SSS family solute:Na+ symporter
MPTSDTELPTGGLAPLDWLIIALYVVGMIALGWYFSRKQRSTEEYFVGGGNMNPTLIGISIFATLLSTISYLSITGETIAKGPVYLSSLFAIPIAFLIVAYLMLPVYMRQRATSAYELLEAKLGVGIRLLGAIIFIALRLVWMSLLVYLAAKAVIVMIGVDEKWIWLIVLCTGFVAVIYTSLGGLRAVVITDLFQTILLFGGALLVVVTVTIQTGGFDWFPTRWQDNWDHQPLFSFDPGTRITVIGVIISTLTWWVCTAGGDQVAVQRFMATRDAKAARRAYAVNAIVAITVCLTLAMVGFALLGYFKVRPDALKAGMNVVDNADFLFPHYIAYHLPPGISGLVVAAMFAAAMSSIDSGVNSITAVVMTDFLDRFGVRPQTERGHVRVAQVLAFGIGLIVVVGSSFMEHVPGNISAVTQKTTNLLVTPLFALFFFALFVPFARPFGVLVGAVCGTTTAVLIAFSGPIFGMNPETGLDPVSFMWISPAALVVNLVTGTVVSLLLPRTTQQA